jgi:CheY-like chemotaxis protein
MVILQQDNLFYLQNQNQNQNRTQHTTPVQTKGRAREGKWKRKPSFPKRIFFVDDNPDVIFILKMGLEEYWYCNYDNNNKTKYELYAYSHPLIALSQFRPNFYDLLLIDINMPKMNGFELCENIIQLDMNAKVYFMSAMAEEELNIEELREVYPRAFFKSFIQKPFTIKYLMQKLSVELGW